MSEETNIRELPPVHEQVIAAIIAVAVAIPVTQGPPKKSPYQCTKLHKWMHKQRKKCTILHNPLPPETHFTQMGDDHAILSSTCITRT
jgi:hypothetical protein